MGEVGRGVRERRRAEVSAALLEAGRRQLARVGAASLSVRAVARDLGMAPSALVRYIADRDDLLTLLIVDAYDDLGAHVEAVEGAVPRADVRARWRALARGVREWALGHPHGWALLYGSPVPDYHAPAGRTTAPGTRVVNLLLAIGVDADAAPTPLGPDAEELAGDAVRDVVGAYPLAPLTLTHGILAWTSLLGAVSAEVFCQLGPNLGDADAHFAYATRVGEWLLFGGVEP